MRQTLLDDMRVYFLPSAGTLLLATPGAPALSGDGRVMQLVVLFTRHIIPDVIPM